VHTDTYVLFGGYGNNGMNNPGLQKQLSEMFPEQMKDLISQAIHAGNRKGYIDEQDINMINRGDVFIAQPSLLVSPNETLHLVSCVAYPRKQTPPSEQQHIRSTFHKGLELALTHYPSLHPSSSLQKVFDEQEETAASGAGGGGRGHRNNIRVITHAMGSFVGHDDATVFPWGLMNGLSDLLAEYRTTR
jgi:hypothetical protein